MGYTESQQLNEHRDQLRVQAKEIAQLKKEVKRLQIIVAPLVQTKQQEQDALEADNAALDAWKNTDGDLG